MNENLGSVAVVLGQAAFLHMSKVAGGLEMRPQAHLCGVCTLSHPLLVKPPQKGMSRGPREQLNDLGEIVPRAASVP